MSGVTLEMSNEMTFWIFQLNLKVCPFTLPPVSQHCLTVAKCVLMTATFSGVYFKESAPLCHWPPRIPIIVHPVFALTGVQREHLMDLVVRRVLFFLWRVFPLFWRQQSSYRLLPWGLGELAPKTRCLKAACLPTAGLNVLRICYVCVLRKCYHRDCVLSIVLVFSAIFAQTQLVPMKRHMIKTTDKRI